MTTPTTNLGMSHIQTEFGGVAPTSLSEYYRGGTTGYVPLDTAQSTVDPSPISTGSPGTLIRMGMFRGVTKITGQLFPSSNAAWSAIGVSGAGAVATINFLSNGETTLSVVDAGNPASMITDNANWWTTAPITGIGNSYWIRATVTGTGGSFSGTTGTWLPLSSNQTWSLSISLGTGIRTLTIDISSSSTGTPILATHTGIVLQVEGGAV